MNGQMSWGRGKGPQMNAHGVQRRMISVDNFFEFLRLLFFA